MDEYQTLSHTKRDCKHHIIFIPKCRRRTSYSELWKYLGELFRNLAAQRERRIEEGHLMSDHVHMMISIPPKYAMPYGPKTRSAASQGQPRVTSPSETSELQSASVP